MSRPPARRAAAAASSGAPFAPAPHDLVSQPCANARAGAPPRHTPLGPAGGPCPPRLRAAAEAAATPRQTPAHRARGGSPALHRGDPRPKPRVRESEPPAPRSRARGAGPSGPARARACGCKAGGSCIVIRTPPTACTVNKRPSAPDHTLEYTVHPTPTLCPHRPPAGPAPPGGAARGAGWRARSQRRGVRLQGAASRALVTSSTALSLVLAFPLAPCLPRPQASTCVRARPWRRTQNSPRPTAWAPRPCHWPAVPAARGRPCNDKQEQ